MERHPTVQDLTDLTNQRRDRAGRRYRKRSPTPPRDRKRPSRDFRSSSPEELFVMEKIEEHPSPSPSPSPPSFGGLNRVWLEARARETARRRICAIAIALGIAVSVLAAYAVLVTVAVASTRAGWVDIGLCPTASPGDNQDRAIRSATPIAIALQIKAQECLSANGSFIKSTPDCVPLCTAFPKAPECLPYEETPTTTTTPVPTGAPATAMSGKGEEEEEDSLGGSGQSVRTDQTPTPDEQESDVAATGRIDIRLVREKRAADATVRRICLCSLSGRRGCRCEDSNEEWPIDIIFIHHGRDVGIRFQDPDVWSMTF